MTRVLFTKPLQKSQLQPTIKASLGFYFALGCNCRMHSCLRVTLAQLTETTNVSAGGRALRLKVFFLSWMGIGHLDCMVNLDMALVLVSEKSMLKGHPAGLIVWQYCIHINNVELQEHLPSQNECPLEEQQMLFFILLQVHTCWPNGNAMHWVLCWVDLKLKRTLDQLFRASVGSIETHGWFLNVDAPKRLMFKASKTCAHLVNFGDSYNIDIFWLFVIFARKVKFNLQRRF